MVVRMAPALGIAAVALSVIGSVLVVVGAIVGAALANGEPIFNAGLVALAAAALLAGLRWIVARKSELALCSSLFELELGWLRYSANTNLGGVGGEGSITGSPRPRTGRATGTTGASGPAAAR